MRGEFFPAEALTESFLSFTMPSTAFFIFPNQIAIVVLFLPVGDPWPPCYDCCLTTRPLCGAVGRAARPPARKRWEAVQILPQTPCDRVTESGFFLRLASPFSTRGGQGDGWEGPLRHPPSPLGYPRTPFGFGDDFF